MSTISNQVTYQPKEGTNIEILVKAYCYEDVHNIKYIHEFKITEIIENQSEFTLTCVDKNSKPSNENKPVDCYSSSFQVVLTTSELKFINEKPEKLIIKHFFHFLLDRGLPTSKMLTHEEMYKFLAEGTITKEGTVAKEDFITKEGFITKGEGETTFNINDYFNEVQGGSGRKMRKRSQSRKKKRKSRAKNMRKKSKNIKKKSKHSKPDKSGMS